MKYETRIELSVNVLRIELDITDRDLPHSEVEITICRKRQISGVIKRETERYIASVTFIFH